MTPSALTIQEQHMIRPTIETALAMRVIELEAENSALRDGLAELGRWLAWAGIIDARALDDAEDFDGGDTRRRIATVRDRILTPNVELTGVPPTDATKE